MKILNFGSLNLDNVYQVPHFLQAGETMAALSEAVHPGGKGLNQSLALARAGAEVYHAGVVGNGSELLTNLLKENGVHDDYLLHCDCTQGSTMIQVSPKGENCILLFGQSNHAITKAQVEETIGRVCPRRLSGAAERGVLSAGDGGSRGAARLACRAESIAV